MLAFRVISILTLCAAFDLCAQTPACTPGSPLFANSVFMPYSRKPMPLSETIRSTSELRLADGNTIRGSATVHAYRDSAGRTRTEHIAECFLGKDGQTHAVLVIEVYDPASNTRINWTVGRPGRKTAAVYRRTPSRGPRPTPEQIAEEQAWYQQHVYNYAPSQREQLGKRTFFGIEATGTRTIHTTPIGAIGNDAPIVTTEESWSIGPGGMFLYVRDDPRTGKSVTEVTEYTPGEPDASLFSPPADYEIVEQNTETTVTSPAKKDKE